MQPIWWILAMFAALYIVLILGPAILSFFKVFSRLSPNIALFSDDGPYGDELHKAREFLQALPHQTVTITAKDGTPLCADFYDGRCSRTVVLLHGYRSLPYYQLAAQSVFFYQNGFNLLLITQRAHGESGGKRSTLGLKERDDLLSWLAFLDGKTSEVLLYGSSMGAATVAYASDRLPDTVKGMVLDCGFTSPYDQLLWDCRKRHLPAHALLPIMRLLGQWVLREDIRRQTTDALKNTTVPALFVQGGADQTVKPEQTEKNRAACASDNTVVLVPQARHMTAFLDDPASVKAHLTAFINKNFKEERSR
ncbi:MAG: alpha/beta hydrolase [Clostridia bacterium]|nr:alpha/beta hydrolase [Clostridia bacterium]